MPSQVIEMGIAMNGVSLTVACCDVALGGAQLPGSSCQNVISMRESNKSKSTLKLLQLQCL